MILEMMLERVEIVEIVDSVELVEHNSIIPAAVHCEMIFDRIL